jgi:hypothetical protein
MKRHLILLFICTLSIIASAQTKIFVSGGAAYSYGKFSGLNYVIERYNQTRQGQNGAAQSTTNMQPLKSYLGLGWRLGFCSYFDRLGIYMGISRTGRSAHTYAEVLDINSKNVHRDLKFTANSIGLEAALAMGHPDKDDFTLLVGGSADYINYQAYTAIDNEAYKRPLKDFTLGLTGFFEPTIMFTDRLGVGLRVSYQMALLAQDFTDLSVAINPATHQNDNPDRISSKCNNLSVQLMLNFVAGD